MTSSTLFSSQFRLWIDRVCRHCVPVGVCSGNTWPVFGLGFVYLTRVFKQAVVLIAHGHPR